MVGRQELNASPQETSIVCEGCQKERAKSFGHRTNRVGGGLQRRRLSAGSVPLVENLISGDEKDLCRLSSMSQESLSSDSDDSTDSAIDVDSLSTGSGPTADIDSLSSSGCSPPLPVLSDSFEYLSSPCPSPMDASEVPAPQSPVTAIVTLNHSFEPDRERTCAPQKLPTPPAGSELGKAEAAAIADFAVGQSLVRYRQYHHVSAIPPRGFAPSLGPYSLQGFPLYAGYHPYPFPTFSQEPMHPVIGDRNGSLMAYPYAGAMAQVEDQRSFFADVTHMGMDVVVEPTVLDPASVIESCCDDSSTVTSLYPTPCGGHHGPSTLQGMLPPWCMPLAMPAGPDALLPPLLYQPAPPDLHWAPSSPISPGFGQYPNPTGLEQVEGVWADIPRSLLIPPSEREAFQSSHPPERLWVPSCHQERNRPTAIFTVMCYNVLCDKYCTRQLYGYSPSWALNWEYRKKGILEEIRHYSADIISLQEVETEHFTNFFEAELKKEGYEGIFAPKSRARTMTENERKHVDGCAIFWKTSKFGLIKEQLIEFNQLAIANAEGSQDMLNRVMTKDNIGLVALLETKEGIYQNGVPPEGQVRQVVMVATVHVVWDPEFCDVKLIQTLMLTNELKNMMESSALSFRPGASAKVDCNQVPMLLCGDFNSLPNSGVVELLREGKVARTHEDFKDISYENILKAFSHTKDNDYLTHGFRMKQALEESFMQYTNYTYDFKGMIDYIFYTEDHMNLLGALGPLSPEWFKENKVVGCPHPHVPSDHFPLVVEFEMPTPTGRQTRSSTSGASNGLGLRR